MKNKKATLFLILSVASVWGIIFYKVVAATVSEEDFTVTTMPARIAYESLDEFKLKDTGKLMLDFPDPFLKDEAKADAPLPAETPVQTPKMNMAFSMPQTARPQVVWPSVAFNGTIANVGNQKKVSMLNIAGKDYMMKEGEEIEGIKLIRNLRDSVFISFQQKKRVIKLQ